MVHRSPEVTHQKIVSASYPRLLTEAGIALGMNVAATALLSFHVGHINIGDIVDYASIAIPLVGYWGIRRRIKRLEKEQVPEVNFPRIRNFLRNIAVGEKGMYGTVDKWKATEEQAVKARINESERSERKDKIRIAGFPLVVGAGRVGLMALNNIPHTGESFGAVGQEFSTVWQHPQLWQPALENLFQNPPVQGFLATALVVGASAFSSWLKYRIAGIQTQRFKDQQKLIPFIANKYYAKYGDDHRHIGEIVVDKGKDTAARIWRRARRK